MGLFTRRKTVMVDSDILVIGGGMGGAAPPYESRYWERDLKTVCVEKANIERSGSDARSGRGLGEMTRRKREIAGFANELDFPHLVELALPPGGFRSVSLEIDVFHRDGRIPVRRGRSRHEGEQFYIRFCFPDTATANAFRNRFGGECLTHGPGKPKPLTSATPSEDSGKKK